MKLIATLASGEEMEVYANTNSDGVPYLALRTDDKYEDTWNGDLFEYHKGFWGGPITSFKIV